MQSELNNHKNDNVLVIDRIKQGAHEKLGLTQYL